MLPALKEAEGCRAFAVLHCCPTVAVRKDAAGGTAAIIPGQIGDGVPVLEERVAVVVQQAAEIVV
jgi:hypothetical protein